MLTTYEVAAKLGVAEPPSTSGAAKGSSRSTTPTVSTEDCGRYRGPPHVQVSAFSAAEFLPEPSHRSIKMMEVETIDAGNVVVLHPGGAVTIRPGNEKPVQSADEDSAPPYGTDLAAARRDGRRGPIRLAAMDNDPSVSSSSALMSNT
jgi:hypothetical protein